MIAACLTLAIPLLAEHLIERSNDPYVVLWARLLSDSQLERRAATRGLAAYGSKKAIQPLRYGLSSTEDEERTYRAVALLQLGYSDPNVVESIKQYLSP